MSKSVRAPAVMAMIAVIAAANSKPAPWSVLEFSKRSFFEASSLKDSSMYRQTGSKHAQIGNVPEPRVRAYR